MPQTATEIDIEPAANGLGARIRGVDLMAERPDPAAIKDALDRYAILVIEGQDLSRDALVEFTRDYGNPIRHQVAEYLAGDNPDVMILSNNWENGRRLGAPNNGIYWHSDQIHRDVPAAYTLLYGHEVPNTGGDTLFSDMRALADWLPTDMRAALEGRRAIHSCRASYEKNYMEASTETRARFADIPDVAHPLLRTHPATGRKAVFTDPDSTIAIEGLDKAESDRLLEYLFTSLELPQFVYRHKWQRGDLVMWDNRCLMHRATGYDENEERRIMWRTQTWGETPF